MGNLAAGQAGMEGVASNRRVVLVGSVKRRHVAGLATRLRDREANSMRITRLPWIILTAVLVHLTWGVLLLVSDAPLSTAPMAETPFKGHQYIAAVIYLVAGLMAILPMALRSIDNSWWALILCIPQQFLLTISASASIHCVLRSSYADGVLRPWEFILADQAFGIIGSMVHTLALLDWYITSRRRG